MNNPEYILTDEMAVIIEAVKTALAIPVLNYQYGYIQELDETLQQWEKDPAKFSLKFPLVWLAEPFIITRSGNSGLYGTTKADLFLINNTDKVWKASERMEYNYKPILYPIYRELLNQIAISEVLSNTGITDTPHTITKGYYWGENQKSVLMDAVDCLKVGSTELLIKNNYCTPS